MDIDTQAIADFVRCLVLQHSYDPAFGLQIPVELLQRRLACVSLHAWHSHEDFDSVLDSAAARNLFNALLATRRSEGIAAEEVAEEIAKVALQALCIG